MSIKTYSELITIPTFEERFEYLQLKGSVGKDTFGYDRHLNQVLYRSPEWKRLRNQIIIRDCGCDLACEGYDIHSKVLIHHLNPITVEDVLARSRKVFDPDNNITYSFGDKPGPVLTKLYHALQDIQYGRTEDKHGWCTIIE